eukprot:1149504-Pelagomonas_calceolata.AAC.1
MCNSPHLCCEIGLGNVSAQSMLAKRVSADLFKRTPFLAQATVWPHLIFNCCIISAPNQGCAQVVRRCSGCEAVLRPPSCTHTCAD